MLKEKLLEDLKECMKNKNTVRKNVVQMVRAGILQVEKDKQITLNDDQIIDIIAKESKKRKDSLVDYEKSGREDLIAQIKEEIAVLAEYLPKRLSEEELENIIKEVIEEQGATSMKDMGKVMKARIIARGGVVEGEALVSPKPLGFNLGVDVPNGIIIEHGHPLEGVCFKDKVFVFPNGKGSTGGSYVVYQLIEGKTGPIAFVNHKTDTIVAAGCIMGRLPTVDNLSDEDYHSIETGDWVRVDSVNGTVEIIRKKGE